MDPDEVEVRPGGGDRGPQLVRRVRDELPLRGHRPRERVEHRVERVGEPPELVRPPLVGSLAEVAGAGDALGVVRQAADGSESRAGDGEAERCGGRTATSETKRNSSRIRARAWSTSVSGRAIWAAVLLSSLAV